MYLEHRALARAQSLAIPVFQRSQWLLRSAGWLGLALAWEAAAHALADPAFPPLSRVLPALWGLLSSGEAWRHAAASLHHIGLGFALAALLGALFGIAMTQSRLLYAALMPLVDAVRPVAALTIFPLLIVLLGLGLWSKVFVIFWTAWPPVLLATVQSIRQVDPALLDAARLDGAGRAALLRRVVLPLAGPGILTGLRIGMSAGWISLVAAEMLGASAGLGYAVLRSSQTFQFPTLYALIIAIALLGLTMNTALALVQRRLEEHVCAW
jgi:ABC-type nitrate/sulfonate/bicarbonate transport system permease component